MVTCAGCERPILERFLLNVLDRAWHAKCVQCIDCQCSLTEKCFSRDAKLYCRNDFFRRFGTKCGGCSQGISPNDMVRRARNKVFHLKCFTCMVCRKQLSTGEELYVLDENRFICKDDYVNSRFNGSDHEDMELELEQQLLDKLEDTMSDKASSLPDEDSRDSTLTPIQSRTTNAGDDTSPALGIDLNNCRSPASSPEPDTKTAKNNDSVNNNNSKNNNVKSTITNNHNNNLNDNDDDDDDEDDDGDAGEGLNKDGNKENSENKDNANESSVGTKRRGPRTTIKAKQLETLKAAFAATPKPTRHIREQLAQETGLNMRVIQVWFQNRRSKERRMKQLSALGARRHFFRNPRRIRGLRPGEELVDNPDMMGQPGFNYFENGEFYAGGYQGYGDYFGQQGDPGNMPFLPPTPGQGPPVIDQSVHPANNGSMRNEGPFMTNDLLPNNTSSPEPNMSMMQHPDMHHFGNTVIPRSLPSAFALAHPPSEMVVGDTW